MASKRRRDVENTEFFEFVLRIVRRYRARVGKGGDLEGLADLTALSREIDEAMAEVVADLRGAPRLASWAEIGAVLGTSRQNAQKRFGHLEVAGARKVGGQPGHLR